jgi:hypothetical protein
MAMAVSAFFIQRLIISNEIARPIPYMIATFLHPVHPFSPLHRPLHHPINDITQLDKSIFLGS